MARITNFIRPERSDEWFQYYSDNVLKIIKSQPQIVNKRIRVAILDSGVDPMDPFIRRELKRRIKYQSFIPGLESVEDKVGHGTHTAALLLRTAQNADVYIGRITIDGKIWSSDQIAKVSNPIDIRANAYQNHRLFVGQFRRRLILFLCLLDFRIQKKSTIQLGAQSERHMPLISSYSRRLVIWAVTAGSASRRVLTT